MMTAGTTSAEARQFERGVVELGGGRDGRVHLAVGLQRQRLDPHEIDASAWRRCRFRCGPWRRCGAAAPRSGRDSHGPAASASSRATRPGSESSADMRERQRVAARSSTGRAARNSEMARSTATRSVSCGRPNSVRDLDMGGIRQIAPLGAAEDCSIYVRKRRSGCVPEPRDAKRGELGRSSMAIKLSRLNSQPSNLLTRAYRGDTLNAR